MQKRIFGLLLAVCLIAAVLPFGAFAADDAYTTVTLQNGDVTAWGDAMKAGDATRYAITTEGAVTAGTADNWNVMLEYPAGGTPVLTLKGANLNAPHNGYPLRVGGTADITVKVETDSVITTTNRAGFYVNNSGLTTITGPGKLSISSTDGICISFMGTTSNLKSGTAIIKDANLDLKPVGSSTTRAAISFTGGDLTIDNSKIDIFGTQSLSIWGYAAYTVDANGKVTKINTTWSTEKGDTGIRNLTIQNGSVITSTIDARDGFGCTGDIRIKDSTVEVNTTFSTRAAFAFNKKPILEGEYTAVAGAKKEGTLQEYTISKFSSYRYVKIVPGKVPLSELGVEEKVTEPTIEETVPPTEVTVPTTEATTPNTVAPTEPEATQAPTNAPAPTEPQQTDVDEDLPIVAIGIITFFSILIVAGGGFALFWFVIRPKCFAKK